MPVEPSSSAAEKLLRLGSPAGAGTLVPTVVLQVPSGTWEPCTAGCAPCEAKLP